MKKVSSALFALLVGVVLSTNSLADTFNLGLITTSIDPFDYPVGNNTPNSTNPTGSLPTTAGPISDEWFFSVDATSSFASAVTSIRVTGSGFSSFNTSLSVNTDGWHVIASSTGTQFSSGTWFSELFYTPLSAAPTEYKFSVFGNKNAGSAGYGGNISLEQVSAVPEPETYALLAAGLGLMGFVARRRKSRDEAVV